MYHSLHFPLEIHFLPKVKWWWKYLRYEQHAMSVDSLTKWCIYIFSLMLSNIAFQKVLFCLSHPANVFWNLCNLSLEFLKIMFHIKQKNCVVYFRFWYAHMVLWWIIERYVSSDNWIFSSDEILYSFRITS